MSNQMNIEKFVADLSNARDRAIETYKDTDTFGTCNFDSPKIPVGKHHTLQRKSQKLEAALRAAGFRFVYNNGGKYFKYYTIAFDQNSEGNRRTKQAEMIRNTMNSLGWTDVHMFYMQD